MRSPPWLKKECSRKSRSSLANFGIPARGKSDSNTTLLCPQRGPRPRIVLDEQNRFSLSVPTAWGTLVIGRYESGFPSLWQLLKFMVSDKRELFAFYVEPGDSLHFVVEEGFFGPSYSFSGPGADNNRFVVEWKSEFGPFSLDYEGLEIADFKRQIDQRRQDQFKFLAEGREEYALTPGFVDYATAFIKYEWAQRMVSYPRRYYRANGRENKAIVPAYYDFLLDIPLADEKAISTPDYDTFGRSYARQVC